MVSTMTKEDDKKKKKGMVVVIALGGKPPKSPEHTADPDEKKKMDDAWQFLKAYYTEEQVAEMENMSPEDIWNRKNEITMDRNDKCMGCNKTLNLGDLEYGACLECKTSTSGR